ncbi:MAG: 4Fe-4S binding protein [Lentisphaerae bacterium]|nr:4Fe-4S binding protein [Lentisphaerota bacterium]
MNTSRWQQASDSVTLLAIGCFAVLSQALLFRDFLGVVEGHELGVACFFAAWLLWVAVGALAGRHASRRLDCLAARLADVALLYLPAFVLQTALVHHGRQLAGIQPYELFPFDRLLAAALFVNAPVSLCTGFLFTLACRRLRDGHTLPVAAVFILESAGSVIGGAAVTALLAAGAGHATAALVGAIPLAVAPVIAAKRHPRRWAAASPLCLLLVLALIGADRRWTRSQDLANWSRHLPASAWQGTFATPQARYRYGEYEGQFTVMAWESVIDTLPATESASRVLAIHLAQQPDARTVLVIGPGTSGLCRRLLHLPQIRDVTWLDADPSYPLRLQQVLPPSLRVHDSRLHIPGTDVRRFATESRERYDIIILQLPAVTTLAQNRLQTVECLSALRERLAPRGLIGIRVGSGENVLGPELTDAGASLYATLHNVFPTVVIKPGDDSWLMASVDAPLTEKPALLRDRFAAIPGAPAIFPPPGLLSLYPPDRIAFQRAAYETRLADIAHRLPRNTDAHPTALLLGLLVAARESGAGRHVTDLLRDLARHGTALPFTAVGLALLLRWAYRREAGWRGATVADWGYVVFATGAAAMAASVLLLFQFQLRHGTFLVHIGLLTALFMLGLTLGSLGISRLLQVGCHPARVFVPLAFAHAALLTALGGLPPDCSRTAFTALFLALGLFSGACVPLAAAVFQRAGATDARAGGTIDLLDHLGGAAGGFAAGLFLIPMFGAAMTALALGLWILSLVPLILATRESAGPAASPARATGARRLGYLAAGIVLFALTASHLVRRESAEQPARQLAEAARLLLAPLAPHPRDLPKTAGTPLRYFAATDSNGVDIAYVLGTRGIDDHQVGYSGPTHLAIRITPDGTLQDLHLIHSDDTPAYIDRITAWLPGLRGHNLFEPAPLHDVDGLTGATLTSRAILRSLQHAGPTFATRALSRHAPSAPPAARRPATDRGLLVLLSLLAGALALRQRPAPRARRLFLILTVAAGGLWLNLQFTSAHVLALADGRVPAMIWSAAFWMVVMLPITVLLAGNLYCGYVCPFGALQELVGELCPRRWRAAAGHPAWATARYLKFVLLAMLLFAFAARPDARLAAADPLVTVFMPDRPAGVSALAFAALLLAFCFGRFWCRTLCPAGAFLSLFNRWRLLRALNPPVVPAHCDYGIQHQRQRDCLHCDRCRTPAPPRTDNPHARMIIVAAALLLAAWVIVRAVDAWRKGDDANTTAMLSAGGMRDVDRLRLQRLIDGGQLSNHEALYYGPVTNATPPDRAGP